MPAAVSSEAVAAALTPAEGATVEAIPAQAGTSCQPAGGPPPGKAEAPAAGPAGGLPPARQSQRPWQAAPPVEAMRRVASDAYTAMRKPDPSGRAQNPLRRRHLAAPALQQRAQQWVAGPGVRPVQPSVGLSGAGQHPVAVPGGSGPALSMLQADGQQAAAGSSAESSVQRSSTVLEAAGTETLPLS
eukprot:jgi/Astpho2/4416/Aster-00034